MKTLHFVYATPYPSKALHRILYKLNRLFTSTPLYREGGRLIDWPQPVYAPYSITFNLLRSLRKSFHIRLYDWQESANGKISCDPDDLLLIHPTPDFGNWDDKHSWKGIDESKIGSRLIKSISPSNIFLIVPYTHDAHTVPWLMEVFEKYIKNVIFICGKFWMDTWSQSPYHNLRLNILRVDMALDVNHYPVLKRNFNPKGKRKFLYLGTTMSFKNIEQLEKIASESKGFEGGYISRGKIRGWKKIAEYLDLNDYHMARLAGEYDFFINVSSADAQATTILEQMSFGMGVACTRESGYDYPSLIQLGVNDTEFNCRQVAWMQDADEEELFKMTIANRHLVEEKHSWNLFNSRVQEFITNHSTYGQTESR